MQVNIFLPKILCRAKLISTRVIHYQVKFVHIKILVNRRFMKKHPQNLHNEAILYCNGSVCIILQYILILNSRFITLYNINIK